jgi:hypothetical protein
MLRRLISGVVVFIGVAFVAPVTAVADTSPPNQVLSNFENYFGANISRDCGFSQPLPGKHGTSIWLFCDTAVYGFKSGKWQLVSFITGSTAAEGPVTPGKVPTRLSELTTAGTKLPAFPNHDGPERFLSVPSGLVTRADGKCGATSASYAASWIYGVTRDAARPADLLISFDNFCVQGPLTFTPEGFGLAVYDPATNSVVKRTVYTALKPAGLTAPRVLGSPVFSGSYLYLFGYQCPHPGLTCPAGSHDAIYLARVKATPQAWDNSADYQWFVRPGVWSRSPSAARSVVSGARPLGGVNVSDFTSLGQGLVMIEQTNIGGGFTVYEARSPAGPWRVKTTGTVPCGSGSGGLCHALIAHPDLSTRDKLLISFFNPAATPYYNPSAGAEGHLEVAAFSW